MRELARLALEDGTVVHGEAFGARGDGYGEVIFNTALTGYQEVVTDPSYGGQIAVMTAPQIGNTGWNEEDMESVAPRCAGLVVRDLSRMASSWRSERSLASALEAASVPGISGVDTRFITRRLRQAGAMRGLVSAAAANKVSDHELVERVKKSPTLDGRDLVKEVTCTRTHEWSEGSWRARRVKARHHIVAFDFGAKRNILRQLVDVGFRVTVVPANTTADEVMRLRPDGIFLSNGPGDPATVTYAAESCRQLLASKTPMFGICLGHQIMGLALGGRTYKLKFGHHGANQPVLDLQTHKVEITSQNHGYAVDIDSLGGKAELSHINLNDQTVEGMRLADRPAFSVQYHPEASPGPHDSNYLFRRFADMIEAQ